MTDELEAPIAPGDDVRPGDHVTVDGEGFVRSSPRVLAIGKVDRVVGEVAMIVPLDDLDERFDTTTED